MRLDSRSDRSNLEKSALSTHWMWGPVARISSWSGSGGEEENSAPTRNRSPLTQPVDSHSTDEANQSRNY
jgi:hypothetical protein